MRVGCKALLALAGLLVYSASLAAPMPDSFADLAEELDASVVNIATTKVVKGRGAKIPGGKNDPFHDFFGGDDLFKRYFGGQEEGGKDYKSQSLGSGFIWDEAGYIITNNHVVEGADEIIVRVTEGGRKFEAKVVGADPKTDVAVLKIEPGKTKLKPVKTGDSDAVRVGDWALALGNPFGLGHTLTVGIISAKERTIGMGPYDSFLQTDADINFGNSGGPLFDIKGRVIGINAAKNTQGAGIGFAIPINMAKTVISQLKKDGKVTRGWLGVTVQEVNDDISDIMGLDEPSGALVSEVVENTPAQKAGVRRGDIIIEFDGNRIKNSKQLPFIVASKAPGSVVDMTVLRNGEKVRLSVTLGELEAEKAEVAEADRQAIGMVVQEITPELRDALNLESKTGLVVTDVEAGGAADDAGIRRGDVIVEVNQKQITSLKEIQKELKAAKEGEKASILLLVNRSGGSLFIPVKIPRKK